MPKFVTKILANRLNSLILTLVQGDQTGFVPGKGTNINIHRLYTHISLATTEGSQGVVASLDSEKAFSLAEWEFLWQVLGRFNIGPKFIYWIKLLYKGPTARVCTNGALSDSFSLGRGTRQGSPLSLGSFALAIEHLAILLRASVAVGGVAGGSTD